MVEDVNNISERSLKDRLPVIIARGVARMVAKSVAVGEAKKKSGELAGFIMNVATTVAERADTRSWTLLPANLLMTRLPLAAGKHDLTATYYSASGNILGTHEYKDVVVKAGRKVFMSDYFMSPPAQIKAQ
jgi:hypothetical protein